MAATRTRAANRRITWRGRVPSPVTTPGPRSGAISSHEMLLLTWGPPRTPSAGPGALTQASHAGCVNLRRLLDTECRS